MKNTCNPAWRRSKLSHDRLLNLSSSRHSPVTQSSSPHSNFGWAFSRTFSPTCDRATQVETIIGTWNKSILRTAADEQGADKSTRTRNCETPVHSVRMARTRIRTQDHAQCFILAKFGRTDPISELFSRQNDWNTRQQTMADGAQGVRKVKLWRGSFPRGNSVFTTFSRLSFRRTDRPRKFKANNANKKVEIYNKFI